MGIPRGAGAKLGSPADEDFRIEERTMSSVRLSGMRRGLMAVFAAVLLAVFSAYPAFAYEADSESKEVISNYLAATHMDQGESRGASMEVNIDASVPKLKKEGKLHALRKISQVGK